MAATKLSERIAALRAAREKVGAPASPSRPSAEHGMTGNGTDGRGRPVPRRSDAELEEIRFVEVDALGRLIQQAVEDLMAVRGKNGLRRPGPYEDGTDPRYEHFCAPMCEAYVYLRKDERTARFGDPTAEPRMFRWKGAPRGDSHYWLETSAGYMDLNFGPSEPHDPAYSQYLDGWYPNRVQGFRPWKKDSRYPSNEVARKIMDTVWRRLKRDSIDGPGPS